MDCREYDLPKALVLNNENLKAEGKTVYAPIYMAMFICRDDSAPGHYKVDLSGLQ